MKRIILAALVSAPLLVTAADKCSVKAEGKKKSELLAMAKVTASEAQVTAFDAAKATKRVSMRLEEDGCFVYAFVVRNEAGTEYTKVNVDPVSGKVLSKAKAPVPEKAAAEVKGRENSAAEVAAQLPKGEKPNTSPAVPKGPPPSVPPKKQ